MTKPTGQNDVSLPEEIHHTGTGGVDIWTGTLMTAGLYGHS